MRSLFGPRRAPPEPVDKPFLEAQGVCPVCGETTRFVAHHPWLRDALACAACGSLPRERALVAVLEQVRPDWRGERMHESSPSSRGSLKFRQEGRHYVASQYDPSIPFGGMHATGDYRSEDLERQTFADASFDIVVTQDVFEHLFRPDLAIAEIARTLAPGGIHICTVPLVCGAQASRRRAVRDDDGAIAYLLAPERHGNPVRTEGSLVTIDWGYDIAAYFQQHGGLATTLFHIDDLSRGIRAELNEVIVARKLPTPAV